MRNGYLAVEVTAVFLRKKFLVFLGVFFWWGGGGVCVCVLILFKKQVYLFVGWLVLLT